MWGGGDLAEPLSHSEENLIIQTRCPQEPNLLEYGEKMAAAEWINSIT